MEKNALITFLLLIIFSLNLSAQNTVVTDDDSYTGNNSAVLDVYSKTKGLLAPRMSTTQRNAIVAPASGLLVYDETDNKFYVYSNSTWNLLDAPSIWQTNSDSIYVIGSGKRYGVGTASPIAKLTVQGDATIAPDEPLFEVKNSTGDVIFAVYENEVKVNFKESAKGVKGGFAVGGLTGTKADPTEYLRITPDSVRVYIKDGAKGVKGGFAVGGLTGTKAGDEKYLTIERDSARIYINNAAKGVKGGFAVGGLTGTKASGANFLDLTPDNYFIGQGAGANTNPSDAPLKGKFNQFFGYEAGFNNDVGLYNILIGYQAGHTATEGNYNTIMGYQAGYTNTGSDNTFIGFEAGKSHTFKGGNVYIGSKAGALATEGEQNVYIGESTGLNTTTGAANVFIGFECGKMNTTGTKNVFMGYQSGVANTNGYSNVFIGDSVGVSNTGGDKNIFIGNYAGQENTYGNSNIYIGYQAGALQSGSQNLFIGNYAGMNNTTTQNLFLGEYAGTENTSGSRNTFVGFFAGSENVTGDNNSYFGQFAGMNNTGDRNTMVGYWAGGDNTSGEYNTFMGWRAGRGTGTNSYNVYLGYRAGELANGSSNVFIGHEAGTSKVGSNLLIIGNSSSSQLIYGEFDNNIVNINGNLGINTNSPAYDLDISGTAATISLGGYRLGKLTGGTGLDNDVIPFSGSAFGYDLGNNNATEHWGDVVATLYITYTKGEQIKSGQKMNLDINLLKDLEPIRYKSDETNGNQLQYGFTIESLSKVAPAALVTSDTDFDEETNQYITMKSENPGINYNALLPVVVGFMQQQQQVIETQTKEIKNHAKEIEALKQANIELKTLIESLK